MDKETSPIQENTKNKGKLQIVFSALMAAIVFIVELYAIINYPTQYVIIGAGAGLILLFLYFVISGIMDQIALKEQDRQDQYENIFKSGKASYITQKKNYEELIERLGSLEKNFKFPVEEIVGSQKGVAKVVINRNRENAEAIMNSNDILVERIVSLERMMSSNNAELISTYKEYQDAEVQQILEKQQELIISLKDMELRLNNMIVQAQKHIPAPVPVMAAAPAAPEPAPIPEPEPMPEAKPKPKRASKAKASSKIKPVPPAEPEPLKEEVLKEEPLKAEPTPAPEPIPEPPKAAAPAEEEKPPMPDLSDPNKKMNPDDIAALFANMSGDSAPAPEPIPEPPKAAAPTEEEKPPMPDLSDPNKKMNPDDIAALFANMSGDSAPAPEPAPVPEPPKAAVPAEEEKPPMPDLSDPNKKMSPDEIAALFANMA